MHHDPTTPQSPAPAPGATMTAVRIHEFGGPEVLHVDEVPVPTPGPGEVLVRVRAVGLNPPDWYLREGMPGVPEHLRPPVTLPVVPGTDVSGEVVAVGPDVTRFAVGDEVFGLLRFPSFDGHAYAQYVAARASDLAPKPATIDHEHAAGAPMAAQTAWQFLVDLGHDVQSPLQDTPHVPVSIGPDTTVLVNGAAGGVGHFAVQLAKLRGARVIGVASGEHEQFLRALGVDEFVDYTTTRPADVVHDVDLVVDTVGGPNGSALLGTLRRGGTLFPVFPGTYDPDVVADRDITISATQVRSNGEQLAEIGALLEHGDLRTAIDSTFPLTEARAAHERADRGHIQGKIVLDVV